MACCGKSRRNRSASRTVAPENPPALKSPPPPTPPPKVPSTNKSAFVPEKPPDTRSVPEIPKQTTEMPKCRYREFKSRTIQGGQTVNVYWCRAFSMNVRDYHCKACQKHDK